MHTRQDSSLEARGSERAGGAEVLSRWLTRLQAENRIEVLFEFETWLRGLCAFFDYKHLPLSEADRAGLVARSFEPEIRIARLALGECERCAITLSHLGQEPAAPMSPADAAANRSAAVDFNPGAVLRQSTPMDSLSRLIGAIDDLRSLIEGSDNPARQDLRLFLSLGRFFRRELHNCHYVDMLLGQRFRSLYDSMDNPALSMVVKSIPEEHLRRNVALVLLHLNRCLRYLALVSEAMRADRPLKRFLVHFALLHEQAELICELIRSRLLKERRGSSRLWTAAELLIHSLRSETQYALERELVSVPLEIDPSEVYRKFENSHGVLRICYQSCIVTLVQAFDEKMDGKTLFPSMVEGLSQGQKLQKELWDLRQELKTELARGAGFDLGAVLDRIAQFRESSMRHLLYQDLGEFENLSGALITAGDGSEVRSLLRQFVSFLETLSQEVSKRSVQH